MISKRKLINALFVAGFPSYGIGTYLSFKQNFSAGVIFSVLPFLLVLLVYGIDLLYRGRVRNITNRTYLWGMLAIASLIVSYWRALALHFPGLNPVNTTAQSIMFLAPFNAAIVVHVTNRDRRDFDFARMMFLSISLLVGVNLLGYGAGLRNLVHGFEGRINLPFMRGIYDAAHLMSILNLMLLFYIKDFSRRPVAFLGLTAFYLVNLAIMLNVNSRLSFMIFLVLTVIFVFRIAKALRGLYLISLFTMPLMMSFSLLIYGILSQPFFAALLGRVDKEDVTTFNGRTYIWSSVADWLWNDRTGLIAGLGYHGQYQLRMLDFVAVLWGEEHSYNFHMHSTFLEIVMDQGLIGLLLFYVIVWHAFRYYRTRYAEAGPEAPLFAAVVYLMFTWQIDIFCFGIDLGFPILMCLLSAACIRREPLPAPRPLEGGFLP